MLWRVRNPSTRHALHNALEEWERANRTLTRLMLAGAHKIPLPARGAIFLVVLCGNPLARVAGAPIQAASLLEDAIRRLEKYYESQGKLTPETRQHFEELVNALAKSSQPRS